MTCRADRQCSCAAALVWGRVDWAQSPVGGRAYGCISADSRAIARGGQVANYPDMIGRYPIQGVLGSGGFATVYLGNDPGLDRLVAIKVLADNMAQHDNIRERFVQEAQIMARFQLESLVRVYEIGDHGHQPFFAMEYCDRGNLADRLNQLGRPVTQAEALDLADRMATIVGDLHRNGYIHRDIKPANFLIRSSQSSHTKPVGDVFAADERLVISDLGLAKDVQANTDSPLSIAAGSPGYSSPEQLTPNGTVDFRTDVFALSAVITHALTRHQPTANVGPDALPFPPSTLTATGPLAAELTRGMAFQPDQRHASTETWHEALRSAAAEMADRPAAPPTPATKIEHHEPPDTTPPINNPAVGGADTPTDRPAGSLADTPTDTPTDRPTKMVAMAATDDASADQPAIMTFAHPPASQAPVQPEPAVPTDHQRPAISVASPWFLLPVGLLVVALGALGYLVSGLGDDDTETTATSENASGDASPSVAGNEAREPLPNDNESTDPASPEISDEAAATPDGAGAPSTTLDPSPEVATIDPNSPANPHIEAGLAHLESFENDEALADFETAIDADPENPAAYMGRASAYRRLFERDLALADLETAIELAPNYPPPYRERADFHRIGREVDLALADYETYFELNGFRPDDTMTLIHRANIYHQRADLEHALADYDQAVVLGSGFEIHQAHIGRGFAHLAAGDYQAALADFDQAERASSWATPHPYLGRGETYRLMGDYDEALAQFDAALEISENNSDAYNGRGKVHRDAGDSQKAFNDFELAVEHSSNTDFNAFYNRGMIYQERGETALAAEDFKRAAQFVKFRRLSPNEDLIVDFDPADLAQAN